MPTVEPSVVLKVLDACVLVLERAGCTVTRINETQSQVTVCIDVPNTPVDIHGERLLAARNAQTT